MKKLLLILLCLPMIGFGQWSNYYNVNANINKNVNVSGTVRNTITTIDYGALAIANAQRETNRLTNKKIALEQTKYRDEKARNEAILNTERAIEIATDPIKAWNYGT